MERFIEFAAGKIYHVYNRGVDKQKIFNHTSDYIQFQRSLYIRNSSKRIDSARVKGVPLHKIDRGDSIIDILAYALMPNHFHLLVFEKEAGGISTFMNKLGTAHAMYFNKKYDRTGPLMCRPFRAKHIDTDAYLRWVISYIHLNPIVSLNDDKSKALQRYSFSSYSDYYSSSREESLILETSRLPIDLKDLEKLNTMLHILEAQEQF